MNTEVKQLYYAAYDALKFPCKLFVELDKARQLGKSTIDAYDATGEIVEIYRLQGDGTYLKQRKHNERFQTKPNL